MPRITRDSFAIRLASESKPRLAMPRYTSPSASATSSIRSRPSTAIRAARTGSSGTPSTRAKSLPRPGGDHRQRALGVAQRGGQRPQQAVAADGDDRLALTPRLGGQLPGVAGVKRLHGAELRAEAAQLGLDLGQATDGAPAGGRRIAEDQQPSDGGSLESRLGRGGGEIGPAGAFTG